MSKQENKNQNEEDDGKTLNAFVYDSVGVKEEHPGSGKSESGEKKTEELSREEALQKISERRVELSKRFVPPHNNVSRHVTEADVERIVEEAKILYEICLVGRGEYNHVYAMAHPQIDDKDPLRFFVTTEGFIIVNPVIFDNTHYLVTKTEGCMSYPEEPVKDVFRYHKCRMSYQTLKYKEKDGEKVTDPSLSPFTTSNYSGEDANIVQHEVAHLNGHDIYTDHSATNALGDKSAEVHGTALPIDIIT